MNQKRIPQLKIVRGTNDEQFQSNINSTLREIENLVSIEFPEDQEFVARLHYEIIIEEPEDNSDQYYLKYKKHVLCCDCPHLQPDPDFRSKTHWCPLNQDRVRMESRACDLFYERLLSKKDHLITPEERIEKMEAAHKEQIALKNEEKRLQRTIVERRSAARREDRLEAPGAARYMFEWPGVVPDGFQRIENKFLRPSEFNIITDTVPRKVTEDNLIQIAHDTDATLWRLTASGELTQLEPEYVVHQTSMPRTITKKSRFAKRT